MTKFICVKLASSRKLGVCNSMINVIREPFEDLGIIMPILLKLPSHPGSKSKFNAVAVRASVCVCVVCV